MPATLHRRSIASGLRVAVLGGMLAAIALALIAAKILDSRFDERASLYVAVALGVFAGALIAAEIDRLNRLREAK